MKNFIFKITQITIDDLVEGDLLQTTLQHINLKY